MSTKKYNTAYTKTRVDMWLWNVATYCKRLRFMQMRMYDEYCYKAPYSNVNAKIAVLRDVTICTHWRPSEAHLFDTLQALKRLTGKELDNDMPVCCSIGLEDYIIKNDAILTFRISLHKLLKLTKMLWRVKTFVYSEA